MAIWEWVLVAALIQHNAWLADGLPAVTIAVNLSSVQFSDPALAERVEEIARVVGVPLDYLELEVTESMLLVDSDAALQDADGASRQGCQDRDRRFRHRLFVAVVFETAATGQAQARPVVYP